MSRLIDFYKKYLARLNKYCLVIILFVAVTYIFGDGSAFDRHKYDERIKSLENEISRYKKEIEQNKKKIEELKTNKMELEQFAREEYLMKKEDEDIFIVE
jgi:Septum formation initiator